MNLSSIVPAAKFAVGRTSLVLSKHAPDILVGSGIVGFIATAVTASKATLTLGDILDKDREDLDRIHESSNDERYSEVYTKKDIAHDKTIVYTRLLTKTVKHYAPSLILAAASTACILGAHGMMRQRLAGAIAAYEAVDRAYSTYKDRIRKALGDEFADEIEKRVPMDEDGPDGKKLFDLDPVNGIKQISTYARVFGADNGHWSPSKAQCEMFLAAQQNYFNDILKTRGHVFLNEVYDALGFDRTPAGAVVGWVRGHGDDYIDFHYQEGAERVIRNVKGYGDILATEYAIDFNVDGVMYQMI